MFNLRSASKSPFGAQLPQGGIQMPNVDPALMQQAAQSPPRRGLFGGLRDRVMGQREDGSTFRDRLMMAGMALQGDGRGAAAYGANLQEQQRAQQETQQAVEQRRQRMQQAVQLVQNIAPDNRALMNAAMMDPDAVLERYLGNMEASNVSAGSTRINPLTGQNYTAPEMFRQDGLYGTQTPDGVTFSDQDALVREGMTADVASTRAGTRNTLDQVRSRREGDALAQAEFDREGQRGGDQSFNAQQTTSAEYAHRMRRANDTLEAILNPQDDPRTPADESQNVFDPSARLRSRNMPFVGDALRGDTARQFDQAADEFALAVLRRESGAAISPAERAEVAALYFPQPGDGPGVIAQKARARQEVIDGMVAASGGAYEGLYGGGGNSGNDPLGLR